VFNLIKTEQVVVFQSGIYRFLSISQLKPIRISLQAQGATSHTA